MVESKLEACSKEEDRKIVSSVDDRSESERKRVSSQRHLPHPKERRSADYYSAITKEIWQQVFPDTGKRHQESSRLNTEDGTAIVQKVEKVPETRF
jgi:hypothetical protein